MKNNKILNCALLLILIMIFLSLNVRAADVAKIGSQSYSSLQDAINSSKENDEIVLLENSSVNLEVNKKVTINLNSKTITANVFGGIKNSGVLTIKNCSIVANLDTSAITNNEGATIKIDNVKCNSAPTTGYCLTNNGTATLASSEFSVSNATPTLIVNKNKGNLIIESGTYKSEIIFKNSGLLTINNGTFEMSTSTLANENKGTLVVKNGNFSSPKSYFIDNTAGETKIMGGNFTGKGVASNYDSDSATNNYQKHSKIIVTGGTFSTTSTAFENSSISSNSTIILSGGKINMSGTDNVLSNLGKNSNEIHIVGTKIDALKSKGINTNNTLIIGENDNKVLKDKSLINIPNGLITGLGVPKIHFYDGTINLKKKIGSDLSLNIITPKNYFIHYDTNADGTLNAYLIDNIGNTGISTSDNDIVSIVTLMILMVSIIIFAKKKIEQK